MTASLGDPRSEQRPERQVWWRWNPQAHMDTNSLRKEVCSIELLRTGDGWMTTRTTDTTHKRGPQRHTTPKKKPRTSSTEPALVWASTCETLQWQCSCQSHESAWWRCSPSFLPLPPSLSLPPSPVSLCVWCANLPPHSDTKIPPHPKAPPSLCQCQWWDHHPQTDRKSPVCEGKPLVEKFHVLGVRRGPVDVDH